ncbi:MAG: class I SAM-dependent RNA methyltransferase [Deltaproteobacteria bacterium]|nr:class I SAM-dependent RNA methyltransferase [Deltaproteobacteria bacterium]
MGVSRGEIQTILTASPHRQGPQCEHYDHCGGCTVQHLTPLYYQDWKSGIILNALHRFGVPVQKILPPVFLGGGTRRRATFTAVETRGKITMGYYRRRSRAIANIENCPIADPRLLELRATMLPILPSLLVPEKPLDIFFQIVGQGVDLMFTGPIGRRGQPDPDVLEAIAPIVPEAGISRIGWRATPRHPIRTLLEFSPLQINFGPLRVTLPPAAFLQPTPDGEAALVNAIMEGLPGAGDFADLFSGCGTFAGHLLNRGRVDAYELDPLAVRAMKKATGGQGLAVHERDLFQEPLRREELNRYDAVIFDPPRAGCPEQAEAMSSSRVQEVIGVSCNPATFSRDARILCDGGYRLESIQVIDQFLWSHHVEIVGRFSKSNRRGS